MNTLHLFVTEKCTGQCPLCCNRMHPAKDITFVTRADIESADLVCITGGEPFLFRSVINLAVSLKKEFGKKVVGYTSGGALFDRILDSDGAIVISLLLGFDGFTVAPKRRSDEAPIASTIENMKFVTDMLVRGGMSFRFYRGLALEKEDQKFWDLVSGWPPTKEVIDRRWRKDDWTTEGSAYRRLPILFS